MGFLDQGRTPFGGVVTLANRQIKTPAVVVGGRETPARRGQKRPSVKKLPPGLIRTQPGGKHPCQLLDNAQVTLSAESVQAAKDLWFERTTRPKGLVQWGKYLNYCDELDAARGGEGKEFECDCEGLSKSERSRCRCAALWAMMWDLSQNPDIQPNSRKTYFEEIGKWRARHNREWLRSEYEVYGRILKDLTRHSAKAKKDNPKTEAVDVSAGQNLLSLLDRAGRKRHALILFCMSQNGGRPSDVMGQTYGDFCFTNTEKGLNLVSVYHGGKNRKSEADTHRDDDFICQNGIQPPEGWDEFVQECQEEDPDAYPFPDDDINTLGASLRATKTGLTTYCFRKHFVARVYAYSGRDKREVGRRLGARNKGMGESFYMTRNMMKVVEYYERAMPAARRALTHIIEMPRRTPAQVREEEAIIQRNQKVPLKEAVKTARPEKAELPKKKASVKKADKKTGKKAPRKATPKKK